MRLLLDTHIALWSVTEDSKLPRRAVDLLLDPDNEIWVSVVVIWELAIKYPLRRRDSLSAVVSGGDATALFRQAGFGILPVLLDHTLAIDHLPPHHRDPFDRMLVAQAQVEPMHLLTIDEKLADYDANILMCDRP